MWHRVSGLHAFGACLVLLLAVCHAAATDAQETGTPAHTSSMAKQAEDNDLVDSEEMAKAFLHVQHALQNVQRRAAGDPTLKHLVNASIQQDRYIDGTGGKISLNAPTDDQIEIPTTREPVKIPGKIYIGIEFTRQASESAHCGLFGGLVMWKTNKSNVFVAIEWWTRDSNAPDRLLAIVREELEREGIRLLPHKRDWPIATLAERLSQFLPPEASPPRNSKAQPQVSALKGVSPPPSQPTEKAIGGGERIFASPQEVVVAYRQAHAKKDWQTCVLCLTPAARGAVIREFIFFASLGPRETGDYYAKLVGTLEKHLEFKLYDDKGGFLHTREIDDFFEPLVNRRTGNEETDNELLYEIFQKRIGDVPGFLADCCQQAPLLEDYDEDQIEGVRIEGDKASGYFTLRSPAPDPKVDDMRIPEKYLPAYETCHFRRIGGSWFLAEALIPR